MTIDETLLDQLMEGRAPGDLFGKEGILSELTKALAERALSTELDEHLGEERSTAPDEGADRPANRRNGASRKTVTTDSGRRAAERWFWTSRATGTGRSILRRSGSTGGAFPSSTARSPACMPVEWRPARYRGISRISTASRPRQVWSLRLPRRSWRR